MTKIGSIAIKNGRVVDPSQKLDVEMDVLLRDGRIAEIAKRGKLRGGADENFDARNLIVAPGFIDLHVHLRQPGQSHKETIASGTAAAAAGGFTAVCTMPNTLPVNDSVQVTTWMQQPERGAVVPVFPVAAATLGSNGEQLTDFAALKRAGAIAITDDGKPILNEQVMREVLRQAARNNMPVIQHAEDTRLSANCVMNAGAASFRLGLRGVNGNAEAEIVTRDVEFARQAGAHLHVAHISTAEALKAVRRGRRNRAQVTCEVTPHHFALTDDAITSYDANFKMNPPLRSKADVEAILVALADGTIDAIASDHAPHARYEKNAEFDRAPFGITGLETALGLAITKLGRERRLPLSRIVELFATGPARVLGWRDRGTLAKNARADVTIFDPARRWTFDVSRSRSKSRNTPFDGWQLTGRVIATIVEGKFVYRLD